MAIETKKYNMKFIGNIAEDGSFKAVFAPLNAIDKHNDITLPGAFGKQSVIIGGYNHGSWREGVAALPVGKGVITEESIEGVMSGVCTGKFFLSTNAGNETYKTIKEIGDMQEWSYSLPEIDYEYKEENGQRVRVLKKIKVNEVSPVLMGAGNGTHTLAIKSSTGTIPLTEHLETVQAAVKGLVERLKALGELRAKEGRHPSEATLKNAAQFKSELTKLIRELDEVQIEHDAVYCELVRFEKSNFEIGGSK